jgi:amino acid adenylation domain-containing protein
MPHTLVIRLCEAGLRKRQFLIILSARTAWRAPLARDAAQEARAAPKQTMSIAPSNQNSLEPTAGCIHELFSDQATRTPDAVAAMSGNLELTYGELNRRANQLAHYLRNLGVGPEVVVGLCVERSPEMIVGLLGILKAGGAYLPLDPAYPPERMEFMLADAKAGLLLTQNGSVTCAARVIALDAEHEAVALESNQNPEPNCTGANLAYVIYTSGSTGRPKGVCVSHASVVHLISECRGIFDFGSEDVWTVVHSYSFDFSVWEIFGSLLTGGQLVIVPTLVTQSPADFYRLLCDRRVTVLNQTPSAARQLHDVSGSLSWDYELSLRLFICGGDALPSSLAGDLLDWNVPLWNFYGPTESTVWATLTKVEREDLGEGSVSIGRAIHDLETYILDAESDPVAPGCAGELYLGGPQLARGYLNRAELTAEKFIPNRFSGNPGALIYKTGDWARYSPDGSIEHLGRLDHQVKVRGFRIELGEIETVINQHPLVREAVVTANEESPGDKRLVAYVVTKGREAEGDAGTILDHQRLAEWQVIWDATYKQSSIQDDPTFNITGWNSSYTSLPYSAEEMKEWVDQTVARLRAVNPQRVLEIGCGSGLLLFRLAPSCEYYVGADPSATAQAFLKKQLSLRGGGLAQVALSQRTAEDFEGFEPESFDMVIINSVAQYFPRVEYLLRVLEGAVRITKSGGTIFVGDVRNLALLDAFHTSVQLSQAPNYLPLTDLRQRVRKNILQDEQLAIDPSFFEALPSHVPRISGVEVQLKPGRAENETTTFRYDVFLRVGDQPIAASTQTRLDWQRQQLDLSALRELLREQEAVGRATGLTITGVPNARLLAEIKAAQLLAAGGSGTVANLRTRLRDIGNVGVDPAEWWQLGAETNREVAVTWAASGNAECYDVIIKDPVHMTAVTTAPDTLPSPKERIDWRKYANDPLQGAFARKLAPQLRSFLRASLPEHMVPSAFVLLDALPLTTNAKIDRAALPAPDAIRPELDGVFVAPRNQTEARVAEVWASVLKLDRVGVYDNFMELGGHSVLATQIVSRLREAFLVDLQLRAIFEAPTVSALAETIADSRRAGIEETGPRTMGAPALPGPTGMAPNAGLPLSFAQQRLWFLDQLIPGTPVYNLPSGIRVQFALDVAALEKSLNEIVRRHEALRTTVGTDAGQPYQVIAPVLEVALPVVDLSALPNAERKAEMHRLARIEAESLFDLEQGPLLRTRLLKLGDEDFLLLVTMHHIISDNWSIVVFFEELSALYPAFVAAQPPPLSDLPIQYADYARWQRDELSAQVLGQQLAFWQQQLAGAPTVLELVTDGPRPDVVTFRAERQSLRLSKSLVQRLRTLSQREGATTFMTLLAVFNLLLYRSTGQDDILVGSPIANRVRTETEGLIGLFLNNLVLRTRLSDELTFRDLLERVRETALGAYTNQDVPFEKLVEALQPQRDLSRTPLFQVFFNLFDAADNEIEFAGGTAEVFSPVEAWTQFDLTLYAAERDETIELVLALNADLFRPARAAEMLEQFCVLLEQIVAEPGQQISQYSLLTAGAQHLLPDPTIVLEEPKHQPITKIFFAKAKETPAALAICKGHESWSYQELSQQAEAIARSLLGDGLRKGEVVAVAGLPSFELIASMLGVLSSGGVLLVLDSTLPPERRKLMMREAGVRRLVQVSTQTGENGALPSLVVTAIGEEGEEGEASIESRLTDSADVELPQLSPDDPAYLFFTSGTSGIPKGVLGCHKGLSHFLSWQREQFSITAADRAAQLTGLSFDVVLRDIFLPLTSGASLHLPDDPDDVISGRILTWLERERITLLHTVPALAQTWLNDLPAGAVLNSLRWAFFAGEPLTEALVRRWRESLAGTGQLVNLYGPTETTLAKCFYLVPRQPSFGTQPVGQPLPNSQALVLNSSNKLCGIGEPGEIVIRTPFRTLGYFNADAENAAAFIINPFTSNENDLLYRTGDRGRYRPDGELEILGRLDDQIKIRGVRVEPAEVNAVLTRHPSVAASIVVPIKDEQGENALVAYVVNSESDTSEVRQLREYLEQHLPLALVPTYFVSLDQLPLTANGKVDRRALPMPDLSFANLKQEFIAPRDVTEELIAGVWSEVLGVNQIGIRDNFFELGGHSLRAMQVLSRINAIFEIELPLAALFAHSTVEGLAAVIEDHLVDELESMPEDEAHQLFG